MFKPNWKLLVLATLGVASANGSHAETLIVPSEYSTLQAAIDAASDGDVVLVKPGTYTGDGFLLRVYPNPAHDMLQLTSASRAEASREPSPLVVLAFDSNGRLVTELLRRVLPAGGGQISIDLRGPGRELGAGVYILEIAVDGEVRTEKLTVR